MNDLKVQTYLRNESPSGFIPKMKYVGLQNCFSALQRSQTRKLQRELFQKKVYT